MATAVLLIGWNQPYPGMQDQAFGVLVKEGVPFLKKHEGKYFERMEMIGLVPGGGDFNGGVFLFGERAKLDEFRRTDEFEAFSMQVGKHFAGYRVLPGLNWGGIQAML
jgi:hypothetical protein